MSLDTEEIEKIAIERKPFEGEMHDLMDGASRWEVKVHDHGLVVGELVAGGAWAKAIAGLAGEVAVPAPTLAPEPKPTELVNSLGVVMGA